MGAALLEILIGLASFLLMSRVIQFTYAAGHWIGGIVPRMLMRTRITWRIGYFLFTRVFHLLFVLKCAGFVLSASGPALPLVMMQYFSPTLLGRTSILIGMMLACLEATLVIMHDVHLMRIPDFHKALVVAGVHYKYNVAESDKTYLMRLARTNYSDQVLPNLLLIIECYGAIAYCAGHLGWLGTTANSATNTPLSSIAGAATFLRVVAGDPFALGGIAGPFITGFFGVCLLLYTMFFISLSSKLIDEDLTDQKIASAKEETAWQLSESKQSGAVVNRGGGPVDRG